MRKARAEMPEPVGFVPTMGYLHEGHLSLIRQARAANTALVVSIFVNPAQFGPGEDYKAYPRNIERDLDLLRWQKVDTVFIPRVTEMYNEDFNTWVEVGGITEMLEGSARSGHFRGVTTVVAKLFNIIRPQRAYFGQKDAQQALVIKKMVAELDMDIQLIVMPTMREPDGLAVSSRNTYLSQEERKAALVLSQALTLAQGLYRLGERRADVFRQEMTALIKKEKQAHVDYVSVAHEETLEELKEIENTALISLAVRIGKTRLIDNVVLE